MISKYRPFPRNIDSLGDTAKKRFFRQTSAPGLYKYINYKIFGYVVSEEYCNQQHDENINFIFEKYNFAKF